MFVCFLAKIKFKLRGNYILIYIIPLFCYKLEFKVNIIIVFIFITLIKLTILFRDMFASDLI